MALSTATYQNPDTTLPTIWEETTYTEAQPLPALPVEEVQKEKVQRRRRGCFPGCGCRFILFSGCLSIVLLVAATIYVFVAKPPAVYNPIKQWLNADLKAIPYDGTTPQSVVEGIKFIVKDFKVGDNSLILTEQQVRALFVHVNPKLNPEELNIDIDSGKLKIYWNGDPDSDLPLWNVIELGTDDKGQVLLTKVGTERIGLPSFVNRIATDAILSALSLSGRDLSTTDLVKLLLPFDESVDTSAVEFQRDRMVVTVVIKTGLE